MKRQPIGVDDFKEIVENNLYFVDKSLLIKEIIDDSSKVVLIARPRRFGKTLNMSLLRYYFEKTEEDTSYLFKEYKIWQQGNAYTGEQGKYPVITLTFKNVKMSDWSINLSLIKSAISSEFIRHSYILKSNAIEGHDKETFEKIYNGKGETGAYINSLELLSKALYNYHKQKPYILLDEYDTFLTSIHTWTLG